MAKATDKDTVEIEVEDVETIDAEDLAMTPKVLAEELEISAKNLRSFLRSKFPRTSTEKNTSWKLTDEQVEAARVKFSATPDEDDESGDED